MINTVNGAGTRHSAIDWRSFDVPGGKTVYFSQPDAASLSINRVLGGTPSAILGTLGSNGRLVLVNPAGIAVGAGAVVDTAGFTASTLFMRKADAIAGRLRFELGSEDEDQDKGKDKDKDKDKAKTGTLNVDGRVLARNGDVVLLGPRVETGSAAVVEAVGGDVIVAAGRKVELTGRGLEGIRMELRAPDDQAVNLGTLKGDSVGIFAGQLRHSGLIQARSATVSGGKVILQALKQGEIDGRIEAANAAHGGSVLVSADQLALKKSTFIDVSHAHGGGEILIGGGSRGSDARLQNADRVDIDAGVVLKADATLSGSGGTVVVWSEGRTDYRGAILARYEGAGRGGRVEVSSRRDLKYKGTVDIGAGGAAPVEGEPGKGKDKEKDKEKGNESKRPAGGSFDAEYVVPEIPRYALPVEVQVALAEPDSDTARALRELAQLAPLSSKAEDPYRQRDVVIDAVQCTVTR
jgi:filamentous hemagglutinin family protein